MIYNWAVSKGWWGTVGQDNLSDLWPVKALLIHSEIAEAVERFRKDGLPPGPAPKPVYITPGHKPEGWVVELVDGLIRTLDLLAAYDIDIDALLSLKMAYNRTRPQRHGGLRF